MQPWSVSTPKSSDHVRETSSRGELKCSCSTARHAVPPYVHVGADVSKKRATRHFLGVYSTLLNIAPYPRVHGLPSLGLRSTLALALALASALALVLALAFVVALALALALALRCSWISLDADPQLDLPCTSSMVKYPHQRTCRPHPRRPLPCWRLSFPMGLGYAAAQPANRHNPVIIRRAGV